jgi:hypothetical protein
MPLVFVRVAHDPTRESVPNRWGEMRGEPADEDQARSDVAFSALLRTCCEAHAYRKQVA